jgi:hypothetical protein
MSHLPIWVVDPMLSENASVLECRFVPELGEAGENVSGPEVGRIPW